MALGQVIPVQGSGSTKALPSPGEERSPGDAGVQAPRGKGKAKGQRPCRFLVLRDRAVVAERLGFTNPGVLSRSPSFLKGVRRITLSANYEPLDESVRFSAVTRRKIMKLKDEDSHALSAQINAGECWCMDWTR